MKPKIQERPIVQTVKLDSALYVRLKTFGAKPAAAIKTFFTLL